MKRTIFCFLGVIVILVLFSGCGPSSKLPVDERRKMVDEMEAETLARFYAEAPGGRDKIKNAEGYGVFSNANVNILLVSGGGGYGVVVDNSTGDKTYMKMVLGGIGPGIGVKDYRQVLIFHSKNTLNKFVDSGWEFGGHADAAAKAGESGGAVGGEGAIGAGIEAYSMTEAGLALQATLSGSKYWHHPDLN